RELERLSVGEIRLGERNEPCRHLKQPANVEVLARLRHHRFVGGDDEHDEIDAADAGQHVLDEQFGAGHVDEGEVYVADTHECEAEIDRDAARLLFLQSIRIGAGERANQRDLPVVDVSRGTYDYRFHVAIDHHETHENAKQTKANLKFFS